VKRRKEKGGNKGSEEEKIEGKERRKKVTNEGKEGESIKGVTDGGKG